jgi:hypothetical protein
MAQGATGKLNSGRCRRGESMKVRSLFFKVVEIRYREKSSVGHSYVERLSPVSARINKVVAILPGRIGWVQPKRMIKEYGNNLRRRQRRAWMECATIQGKTADAKPPRMLRQLCY